MPKNKVVVRLVTDKKYGHYLKTHLEKEHPRTKGHIQVYDPYKRFEKMR